MDDPSGGIRNRYIAPGLLILGLKEGKKMDYLCTEKRCTFEGNGPYTLHIPLEVWERHNTAVPFCPHCGGALNEKDEKIEEGV